MSMVYQISDTNFTLFLYTRFGRDIVEPPTKPGGVAMVIFWHWNFSILCQWNASLYKPGHDAEIFRPHVILPGFKGCLQQWFPRMWGMHVPELIACFPWCAGCTSVGDLSVWTFSPNSRSIVKCMESDTFRSSNIEMRSTERFWGAFLIRTQVTKLRDKAWIFLDQISKLLLESPTGVKTFLYWVYHVKSWITWLGTCVSTWDLIGTAICSVKYSENGAMSQYRWKQLLQKICKKTFLWTSKLLRSRWMIAIAITWFFIIWLLE